MANKALMGHELMFPPVGRMVRPPKDALTRLRNLHARACRVAETNPEILGHGEVARTLQHDYIHALVHCLMAEDARVLPPISQQYATVVLRFEDALLDYIDRGASIAKLCTLLGVRERTLRMYCTSVLGMSPSRYIRLRQQNLATTFA
jgi:AraC-like DNA-binding protein